MKKNIYLIFSIPMLIFPTFAYADCTDEEINHFEEIKDQYKIEYSLDKTTSLYTLTLHNPEPSNYTYNINGIDTYLQCQSSSDSSAICNKILPGGYTINIIGNNRTCTDILKRMFLNLEPYNKYSEDPLCSDIKEFVLCQETYDKEIDYETFVMRVNAYKESQNKEKETKNDKSFNINKIKEYIENNLFQVIVISIFVILIIITVVITIITTKKSRRLE